MEQFRSSSPSDFGRSTDSFPSDLTDVKSLDDVFQNIEDTHPRMQPPTTSDLVSSVSEQTLQANSSVAHDRLKALDEIDVVQSGFFAEFEKVQLLLRALSRMVSPDRNEMLLALALTCKAVYEPTMDILWENMDITLFPLLKILPAFKVIDGSYVISGPVTGDDVNRLKSYASRVKTISQEVRITTTPMPNIVPQPVLFFSAPPIRTQVSPQNLLPISQMAYIRLAQVLPMPTSSLHHLHLKEIDSTIQHVPLLVAPSLEALEVSNTSKEGNYIEEALLEHIFSVVPSLKHIKFSSSVDLSPEPHQALDRTDLFCRFIAKYRDIQTLNISGFFRLRDFSVLEAIGELPHLKNFTLDVQQVEYTKRESSVANGFRSLRKLHITASLVVIQDLLQASQGARLENAVIITLEYPKANVVLKKSKLQKKETVGHDTPDPLESLTSYRKTLRSLSITLLPANCHVQYTPTTLVRVLRKLSSLEYFEASNVTLSCDQLKSLVTRWPWIKTIKLPLHNTSVPSLKFSTLLVIAKCCPHLRTIQCDIEFDDVLPDLNSLDGISPHRLEQLTVSNYPSAQKELLPEHIRQIALFIIAVFPQLQIFASNSSSVESWPKQWKEISDFVIFYREARFWSNYVLRASKHVAEHHSI